jgi:2-iminoacetate synthase ThiH
VPIPDSLPEQSPLTGTTGLEDLRVFACARLLLPGIARIAVEADLHGPKLAAVALSFGADTLAGAHCVATARLTPADAEKQRSFNADRARLLLAEAGRAPLAPPPFPPRDA